MTKLAAVALVPLAVACVSTGAGAPPDAAPAAELHEVDDYCERARAGDGAAQYAVGLFYAGEFPAEAKNKLMGGPDNAVSGGLKDMAARARLAVAMAWLDLAALNGQPDAAALRGDLGLWATPQDFKLYSIYSRMGVKAPCIWEDMNGPGGATRGLLRVSLPPSESGEEVPEQLDIEGYDDGGNGPGGIYE